MAKVNLRRLGGAAVLLIGIAGIGRLMLVIGGDWPFGRDEFGRNTVAAVLCAISNSLALSLLVGLAALSPPVFVAFVVSAARSRFVELLAYSANRILDVVPLFLWAAIGVSFLGSSTGPTRALVIVALAFPFVLGLALPSFSQVAGAPYALNSSAAGVSMWRRLLRQTIPNVLPSLAYPFLVVVGLAITFDALMGVLGLASRAELSLGVLIWRAKERFLVDTHLALLALGAAILVTLEVWLTATALTDRSPVRPIDPIYRRPSSMG